MHPAVPFRHKDSEFRDRLVREIGFASIFLTTPDGPRVAHTPIEWNDGALTFHLARTNALTNHLDTGRALAVVQGPDAYISARWYETDNQVPTWNYLAFELEGTVHRIEDNALPGLLERLSAHHEGTIAHGQAWTMDKMDEKALKTLLRGIAGFSMSVDVIRETVKLSQNKPEDERKRLISGLKDEGRDEMADLMRGVMT